MNPTDMSTDSTAPDSTPDIDISDDAMMAAAIAADAGQPIPVTSTSPAPETPDTPPADGESAKKTETADARAEREALEEAAPADAEPSDAKPKPAPKPGEKPETAFQKAAKDAQRKDRTWKALEAEKAQVRQDAERLAQERAELTRWRAEQEQAKARPAAPAAPAKDEHGLSVADYDRAAERYARAGDDAMAQLAKDSAARLRASAPAAPAQPAAPQTEAFTTPEFQAKWRAETAALVQAEPDLARSDNPVVIATQALLQDRAFSRFFLSHPDGIRAAVEVGKLRVAAGRAATLEKELTTQRQEIARLTKLTNPRGSLPASAQPADRPADEISDADMLALARQADAAG